MRQIWVLFGGVLIVVMIIGILLLYPNTKGTFTDVKNLDEANSVVLSELFLGISSEEEIERFADENDAEFCNYFVVTPSYDIDAEKGIVCYFLAERERWYGGKRYQYIFYFIGDTLIHIESDTVWIGL